MLVAAIWDVDLTTIFGRKELAEGRLRSEGSGVRCSGGTDLVPTFMFIVSSKSRKDVSVDRIATIRGTSGLAVWRMNNTMTLKMYLMQESSRAGGSSHDDNVEGSFCIRCPELGEVDNRSLNELAEELEEDECRVQRDAIVRESTFKIKSCD